MSISTALAALKTAKSDIADAIATKGGTVNPGDGFSDFATDIGTITGGGGFPDPPDDGKTRLYIEIPSALRSSVPLYFNQSVSNGVSIDWGDGSPTETISGTGNRNITHNYGKGGYFVIALDVTGGKLQLGGGGISSAMVGGNEDAYLRTLRRVKIGVNVENIRTYAFYSSQVLTFVWLADNIANIGSQSFSYCFLTTIEIPASVTRIENNAFYMAASMKEYYFLGVTPPTLGGTGVFFGIPSDCTIYVPVGSLTAYQTATNWSAHAAKMKEIGT